MAAGMAQLRLDVLISSVANFAAVKYGWADTAHRLRRSAAWLNKEQIMSSLTKSLVAGLMFMMLGGCADMSRRDQNTAIGAAAGALAGSVLTGGDALGTVGGAAVGGLIGNQVDGRHRR